MLVAHSGLAWWWASVFSSVIFAGSFESLLIGLAVAAAPLAQIALTAFLVNSRHVFYALSFPLHGVTGKAGKIYSTFAMTDEAYALTADETARSWPGRRILWLQAFIYAYWVTGATAGAALGTVVSMRIAGLGFAITALFAVLAVDAFRARRDVPTPILAVACALVAHFAFPSQMLLAVMVILLAYTLRTLPLADPTRALPGIAALAATLGLHLWRRNAVLSILGGTAINVVLVSTLFHR
jgi:4-azaleucine resistance transporter AzlC